MHLGTLLVKQRRRPSEAGRPAGGPNRCARACMYAGACEGACVQVYMQRRRERAGMRIVHARPPAARCPVRRRGGYRLAGGKCLHLAYARARRLR
jgi:hypothetical protein